MNIWTVVSTLFFSILSVSIVMGFLIRSKTNRSIKKKELQWEKEKVKDRWTLNNHSL